MEEELYSDESGWSIDTNNDDENQKDNGEAETFDPEPIRKRRCAKCGHFPLIPYVYAGFSVLYCTSCDKPVCLYCKYPGLEKDGEAGLYCTKCGHHY